MQTQEEKRAQWRKYYWRNRELVLRKRHSKLPERNKYLQERRKNSLDFRLREVISIRILVALKGGFKKFASAEKLLGASLAAVKEHLQSQFLPGMSWENHGKRGWHIDHIKPCASFDLSDPEQQKQCFHYTNLQPLWAKDNMKKGDKII